MYVIWQMPIQTACKLVAFGFEIEGQRCMGHRDRIATAKTLEEARKQIKELENES